MGFIEQNENQGKLKEDKRNGNNGAYYTGNKKKRVTEMKRIWKFSVFQQDSDG